jgi:hypothetical protein
MATIDRTFARQGCQRIFNRSPISPLIVQDRKYGHALIEQNAEPREGKYPGLAFSQKSKYQRKRGQYSYCGQKS